MAFLYSNAEHAHLALGDTFQARQFRERARELAAEPWSGGRADPYGGDLSRAARAFTRAGRDKEGIELLEGVRETPGMLSRYDLRLDPEWDPLRDHPRFQGLLGSEW